MENLSRRMPLTLDATDEAILEALEDGARTPAWLLHHLDLGVSTRSAVQQRLRLLDAAGHAERIGDGLYQLPGEYVYHAPDGDRDVRAAIEAIHIGDPDFGELDAADVDSLLRVREYVRDHGAASPQDLRDDVHDDRIGKSEDYWWKKVSKIIDEVPGIHRESQRRIVWTGD